MSAPLSVAYFIASFISLSEPFFNPNLKKPWSEVSKIPSSYAILLILVCYWWGIMNGMMIISIYQIGENIVHW